MTTAKLKILAINDEESSFSALSAIVAHAFPGADFFTATTGLKGIELALSEDPDIILLDIVMPEMDGYEVCRRLKQDIRLTHIPVAFMTALEPDEEVCEKAVKAGADTFIFKPFKLWEITVQLRAMLKLKAANILQRDEHEQLGVMVAQRTRELADELAAREKALELLTESEALFKTMFTEAPMGICLVDSKTGHFLSANPMFARIFGRPVEGLGAFNWHKLTHPDDIKKQSDNLALLDAGKIKVFQMEKRYLKPDGAVVWVKLTVAPLPTFGNFNPRYLGMIEDISAGKAAEQEKLILEEQLRQSQKMETAGRLAGGIAHDFNNILAAILAYTGFLLKDLDKNDPRRTDAEEINKAVLRAAALTRQLLAFSRKQILQPKVLDINLIILGVQSMLKRLIGENIKLTAVTCKTPALVKADPGYLEQVLLNLCVNARDAMPKGGKITIESSIVVMDKASIHRNGTIEPGNYVMLTVTDTGCGMSAETQSHIFEPFFTTKPHDKGTGLGLSTVHGIVKQSGGHILVYSEAGNGAVFKVYLAQIIGEAEMDEQPVVIEKSFTGDGTVLVVDDDISVRTPIRRVLVQNGFLVLEATSAEEALAICKRHKNHIHLLLTDMLLPKMDGLELAGRLKAIHPEIKAIFMSGYTDHTVVEKGLLDLEKNFIQKPFTFDTLLRKTREALCSHPFPVLKSD